MATDTIKNDGLTSADREIIKDILSSFPHIEEAILFGSRAKGIHKPGSDIDLAIKGPKLTKNDISSLFAAFEESLLPYFVDVIAYSSIRNEALQEHIDRIGISIFVAN